MTEATNDATAFLHDSMSLTKTLGVRAVASASDRVVLELDWSPDLLTAGGLLHGGAVMALADSAGGLSAFLNLPDGAVGTSTIESKTNFIGGVKEGDTLRATSCPLHVGGMTIVVETTLTVGDRLVGKVTQTQTVLHPRS
ncbi:PaaI family thioesterase [Ilumatobacter nonamiensis]|uniref:PaaI family thioesterase n=1 Tax=Ilumatobacter nonamiensis TaxID=467093 RepID=UPI000346E602|nr:PaaI family thioesterase [Ilumatobacter nonamiensis]